LATAFSDVGVDDIIFQRGEAVFRGFADKRQMAQINQQPEVVVFFSHVLPQTAGKVGGPEMLFFAMS
jgi:hypothetical protein